MITKAENYLEYENENLANILPVLRREDIDDITPTQVRELHERFPITSEQALDQLVTLDLFIFFAEVLRSEKDDEKIEIKHNLYSCNQANRICEITCYN